MTHKDVEAGPACDRQQELQKASAQTCLPEGGAAPCRKSRILPELSDYSPEACVVFDLEGLILDCNKTCEELFGLPRHVIVSRNIFDLGLLAPEDIRETKEDFTRVAEGQALASKRFNFTNAFGRPVVVDASAHRVTIDGQPRVFGVARDVTRQVAAEDELVRAKEIAEAAGAESAAGLSLLRATLESTADGILVVDPGGKIVTFNHRFVELWQIPDSVLASQDDDDALASVLDQLADPEQFLQKVRELYAHPTASSFDTLEFKDGRVYERHSRPQLINDQPIGRVWSFRDVTEHKQVLRELQEHRENLEVQVKAGIRELEFANVKLVRTNEALTSFAFSAAHELRAPLRAIGGFAQILCAEHASGLGDGTRLLNVIRESADRMSEMIDDLLKLARMSNSDMRKTLIDMAPATEHFFREVIHGHRGDAILRVDEDIPQAWADPAMMRGLLTNLLSNAVKFVDPSRRPTVEVGGYVEGGHTVYFVKDNGIGFEDSRKEDVFRAFKRLHEGFEGTGIGLAIVGSIIERHAGRLWAEGRPGEGATFFFSLPAP